MEDNPRIIKDEEWKVFVNSLGDSAVILGIRAWVKTEDYWPTRWKLLEEIKLTFDAEGIEIPYNQMTVHISKESPIRKIGRKMKKTIDIFVKKEI